MFLPLSFTIPLAAGTPGKPVIAETNVHYLGAGVSGTPGQGCNNVTAENPEAEPGNLCVYAQLAEFTPEDVEFIDSGNNGRAIGAGTTGANMKVALTATAGEPVRGEGTWAVTAP